MNGYQSILDSQKRLFRSGVTKPVSFRIKQLKLLKKLVSENEELLMAAVYDDFKKPAFETFATEIGIIKDEINFAIRKLPKWVRPQTVPSSLVNFPSKNYILKEPYGSVLIIAPWNYPVQLLLLPLVGALSAGNTAILKPSELALNTSSVIKNLIVQYFEPDLVTVIEGGIETNKHLLALDFDYIFFTGSTRVGKIVMQAAAEKLIPVTLELGGKSPCIVDESADLKITAKRIVWGKFLNAGQTCVAPDYVLVQTSVKEHLLSELRVALLDLYGNDPQKSPDYPRIINASHFNRLIRLLENGTFAVGGVTDSSTNYISPTVLDEITWDDPVMKDEIFGPILPILSFEDINDAIAQVQNRPRPLALYIFTSNNTFEKKILADVSFGGGAINDTIAQLGNHHLSFGGVGASGFGAYHGKASFDSFSHQKSIMKKPFWPDIPIRYAPYNGKIKWLKQIFR